MGRFYIATIDIVAATTQKDIVNIATATGKPVAVHELLITTDIETDANEAQIELQVSRYTGTWTTGSGGAAVNATPLDETGAADATVVRTGDTTQAVIGTGAQAIMANIFVNNRVGLHLLRPPEAPIRLGHDGTNDSGLVVQMQAAAAAATAWGGYVIFEETG